MLESFVVNVVGRSRAGLPGGRSSKFSTTFSIMLAGTAETGRLAR